MAPQFFSARLGLLVPLALTAATGLVAPRLAQAEAAAPPSTTASAAPAKAGRAPLADERAAKKVVGLLIKAIRFNKPVLADQTLGFATMAESLLGPAFTSLGSPEQAQFVADFKELLVAQAFARGRELFQYLDGVFYGPAKMDGPKLTLPSTIVVHRNLKKAEYEVAWVLAHEGGSLRIIDVVSLGESTTAAIAEQEVAPLLKAGGASRVLAVVHERAAKVRPGAPHGP